MQESVQTDNCLSGKILLRRELEEILHDECLSYWILVRQLIILLDFDRMLQALPR